MAERMVALPVTKKTREGIKKLKGTKSFEQFLREELL
jgi:hypothetical protein